MSATGSQGCPSPSLRAIHRRGAMLLVLAVAVTLLPSPVVANEAPIAVAGDDLIVNRNQMFTLNGNMSLDPDGDPLNYTWLQNSDPMNGTVYNDVLVSLSLPWVGVFVFQLIVDDGPLSDSDTMTVTVVSRPVVLVAISPPADVGLSVVLFAGETIPFSVTAFDEDGDPLMYRWSVDGVLTFLSEGNVSTFLCCDVGPGDHVVEVLVSDGTSTTIAQWSVTVVDGAEPKPPEAHSSPPMFWIPLAVFLVVAIGGVILCVAVIRQGRRPPTPPTFRAPVCPRCRTPLVDGPYCPGCGAEFR